MDLVSLNASYKISQLIENYSSLIWTERYAYPGEFQLKTNRVQETMDLMPIGGFVSHRGTKHTMIVENYSIEGVDDGTGTNIDELTVTGRSWESILEYKISTRYGTGGDAGWPENYAPVDDDGHTDKATVNNSANRMLRRIMRRGGIELDPDSTAFTDDYAEFVDEQIPNVMSGNAVEGDLPDAVDWDDSQLRYTLPWVQEILNQQNWGIRSRRPDAGDSDLTVEFYDGENVSANVILHLSEGHIANPKYLFSRKQYRNFQYMVTEYNATLFPRDGLTDSDYEGVERQIVLNDASNRLTLGPFGAIPSIGRVINEADNGFKGSKQQSWFDCEVAPTIPYVYGTDYKLGDRIRVTADYGVNVILRVTEFTRSEDANGEVVYPGLSTP